VPDDARERAHVLGSRDDLWGSAAGLGGALGVSAPEVIQLQADTGQELFGAVLLQLVLCVLAFEYHAAYDQRHLCRQIKHLLGRETVANRKGDLAQR